MIVEVIAEVEAVAEALSIDQGEIMQDLMIDTRPEPEMNSTSQAVIMVGKIKLVESQGRQDIITPMISEKMRR